MTIQEDITKIYIGYFGRAGDPTGFNYWIGQANDGGDGPGGVAPLSLREIAASYSVQPESTALYPFLANPLVADSTAFITQVYQNLFNRAPDQEGLTYWKGELAKAAGDPQAVGAMIINIISGARNTPSGQDLTIINNKVEVALDWVQSVSNVSGFSYVDANGNIMAATEASAKGVLNGVDDTAASVTAAKAETDVFVAGGAGQAVNTVNLKSTVDALTGTTSNDLFSGTSQTFSDGDSIDGSSGTDTLKIVATSASSVTPTLTSIENLEVVATHSGTTTVDLAASSGLASAALQNSSGALSLVNVDALVDLSASDTTGAAGLSVGYDAPAVSGTSDTQKIALDNAVLGSGVVINGAETFEVTATGTNSVFAFLGNMNTIVDGAGSLTAMMSSTGATGTFDASAATGDQDITFFTGKGYTVTSGGGDDVFDLIGTTTVNVNSGDGDDMIMLGASLDAADTINGGAGKDTLAVTNATGKEGLINAATGLEVLMLTATTGALTATDYTSINEFVFDGGPNGSRVNIKGVQSEDRFVFSSDQNNSDETLRFESATVGQALTMELRASEVVGGEVVIFSSSTTNNDEAAIGFQNAFSSVTIDSTGSNTNANMIHAADVGSNVYSAFDNQNGPSTFNITGTQDLNIGAKIGDAMSSNSDTFGFHSSANVDASSFAGNLRIAGSSSADVLTGGSGDDVFYGMGGDDVLRGNDGADQFRFVGDNSTDLIVDFTAGTDQIGFNTATTINFSNTTATNAGATLSAADYIENRSAITALGASDDDKVVEMQAALSAGQVTSDVGAAIDAFVLLFNSTTTKGELWYDSDWSNAGGRTQVATFDNVDDLVGIQGMSNTDFVEFIA